MKRKEQGFATLLVLPVVLIVTLIALLYFFYTRGSSGDVFQIARPTDKFSNVSEHENSSEEGIVKVETLNKISLEVPEKWFAFYHNNSKDKLAVDFSDWNDWEMREEFVLPENYIFAQVETLENNQGLSLEDYAKKLVGVQMAIKGRLNLENTKLDIYGVWGKEEYSEQERDFRMYLAKKGKKVISVTAFSPQMIHYRQEVDDLARSLNVEDEGIIGMLGSNMKKVLGVEDEAQISGVIEGITFKELTVMNDPIRDSFEQEQTYDGRLAKGYVFDALTGQRLTTVVDELWDENGFSFVRTYLFDSEGRMLFEKQFDTRIEFVPEYSGTYYLVVINFKNNDELNYKVQVEDRNLTEFVIKVKDLETGAEVFVPHEQGLQTVTFADFAFLIDFNGIADQRNSPVKIHALPGSVDQFKSEAFFPEDSEENLLNVRSDYFYTEINIVYPVNDKGDVVRFPDDSQLTMFISFNSGSGYVHRAFTDFSDTKLYLPQDDTLVSLLGKQRLLVVAYNYQDKPLESFTSDEIQDAFGGETNSLADFIQKSSDSKVSLDVDVAGWYTLPYNSSGCPIDYGFIEDKLSQDGFEISDFERVVYLGLAECGGGSANSGGNPTQMKLNTLDRYVMFHEFGHNLTLHHSGSLQCGDKQVDEYANCTVTAYGDEYTPMGRWNTYDYHMFQKGTLGWLNEGEIRTVGEGTHYLFRDNTPPGSAKLLRVKKVNTNEYYYLEYRSPTNYNASLPDTFLEGATIRIGFYIPTFYYPNMRLSAGSYLIDTNPDASYDFSDAPLSDGKSFVDEINGLKITQVSHDNDKAELLIENFE